MSDGTFTLAISEELLFEQRQARKLKELREENDKLTTENQSLNRRITALLKENCRLQAALITQEPEYPLFDRPINHGVAWGQE